MQKVQVQHASRSPLILTSWPPLLPRQNPAAIFPETD